MSCFTFARRSAHSEIYINYKSRANMIEWMNFKKYKISQKLLDLYEKAYK